MAVVYKLPHPYFLVNVCILFYTWVTLLQKGSPSACPSCECPPYDCIPCCSSAASPHAACCILFTHSSCSLLWICSSESGKDTVSAWPMVFRVGWYAFIITFKRKCLLVQCSILHQYLKSKYSYAKLYLLRIEICYLILKHAELVDTHLVSS